MCGVAGIIDLCGRREPHRETVEAMTEALVHRGPDEDGYLFAPGMGLGHRRLSIVGLEHGRQPIFNEDRTVAVMFNGELFDHEAMRQALKAKGHVFKTTTDTEVLVHLYEDHGEDVFLKLNGQFAAIIVDFKQRLIFLARDRAGICPLFWAREGDWLYVASEPKSILASGDVTPICDRRGLDQIFNFFAIGGRRSMFAGINAVLPGHYLKIAFRPDRRPAEIVERRYWDFDFPDAGQEENPEDITPLVDQFEAAFHNSVDLRLRADVPVVGYLSGGVDSAYVLATAAKIRGTPPPSFTIRVPSGKLDEVSDAMVSARHIGSNPTIVTCGPQEIRDAYPALIRATDSPVIDTSCAALYSLAAEVHRQNFKVALTGEGADEAFAGYVWFKTNEFERMFDAGRFRPSHLGNRVLRKLTSPATRWSDIVREDQLSGGPHAQTLLYSLVARSRHMYYSRETKVALEGYSAYEDLPLDLERMRRWHPLNRSLYLGYKVHLPGLLLNHKGDRIAMANSVETRYPFLDNGVIDAAARIHPDLKLRGRKQDKFLLRKAAERLLPQEVAWRPKGMFRAPFAESFFESPPEYVEQLMSAESLARAGYFDVNAVRRDYQRYVAGKVPSWRVFMSMGLGGVLSTQLWHHINFGGGLCDLAYIERGPQRERPPARTSRPVAVA
ncbi:MAG: asparagine synthase (glutamine-hydrolyzing) [Hyphomicrobiaceae bacterium]|nr:asparagine synthase (glutamine-hydrolyzing) [Hyphomicrobiaceae bacterium]